MGKFSKGDKAFLCAAQRNGDPYVEVTIISAGPRWATIDYYGGRVRFDQSGYGEYGAVLRTASEVAELEESDTIRERLEALGVPTDLSVRIGREDIAAQRGILAVYEGLRS